MAKGKHTSEQTESTENELPVIPVVAIGASAGGMESMLELLENLSPVTNMAYVYIQHLDPNAHSHLTHILSRATVMPVREAEDQLRIEPNHVYVIPSNQDMEVMDGVLVLLPRQADARHMPIDQFFISLANRQKEAAIAVILSGMANDGTLGFRAIKQAGGVTFVQNDTARFQSMPKSAIAEGLVDWVLPPAEIARELERISRKPEFFQQTELAETNEEAEADEDIKVIIQLVRKAVGVNFSNYKITTIRRRIIRRMLLFKLETLKEYIAYIRQQPEEMPQLYSDLLINVTTFFRDQDTMTYLSKVLFPRIIEEKAPREPFRIWVPACSTGQEAYSLAMLLIEALGDKASSVTIQIFATDLSETAVAKARQGSYTKGEVMDVSPRRLQRFFTKTDDYYRINRAVRDLCVFAPHNILKDPPFSRLDLISCRNLLIYLGSVYQRKAIAMFHYGLNPSGYLLLGKSETIGSLTALFSQIEKKYKVYVRKNDVVSRASFEMSPRFGFDRSGSETAEVDENKVKAGSPADSRQRNAGLKTDFLVGDLEKIVDELLLRQYVPASVVVDNDLDILRFRGSTSMFLEPSPGKASLNLLKMARPALVFELRNTVHKARQSGQPVRKSGLEVKIKGVAHQVTIEVVPLNMDTENPLYLVLFEEVEATLPLEVDLTEKRNLRIKQLEAELATLRDDMRSIVEEQEANNEELQSANEEIISSNEELQSINEELETSKEEIESTNEELLTINQELQVRNDQLSEANEFSEIIFATIREATLVLDDNLRIKSANKTFYTLFRVDEEQTEGRLIYEIGNRQWDIPKLRLLLTDVIRRNIQVDAFEITHTFDNIGEKVLLVNARRVVRQEEAILLAFEDITDHRRAQRLLAEREAWLHDLVDNAPVLIWVSNADGKYTFFNRAWLDYTGHSLEETIDRGWMEDIHPDDRQAFVATFTSALAKRLPFQLELRLKRHQNALQTEVFPPDDYHWMLMNASPTFLSDGRGQFSESRLFVHPAGEPAGVFSGFIGTCAEIYSQKTLIQALDLRAQQRMQKVFSINAMVVHAQQVLSQTQASDGSREKAQENLKQHENDLKLFVDSTSDVITRWSPDLRLLYANPAFEKIWGVPVHELLGKTSQEMGQPVEIALPYMNKLQQVFDTGLLQNHYNSFPTADGLVYYYSRLVPELDMDGSVKSVLAIAQDIGSLQLVEEIQQTAVNLQAVLDSSSAAIGLLQAVRNEKYELMDFELTVCNQRFATMVRQPIDQMPGLSLKHMAEALWQDGTFDNLEKVLLSGQRMYIEKQVQREGRDQWIGMSITKHNDGVVLSGMDITALKKAEQDKKIWLTELEQSSQSVEVLEQIRQQMQGEFLRSTSHDLRGNLGIIQGAVSMLDMADTDEERNQMMAMLQRNIRQATQMLTELLDYSRLEAGQEERNISSVNINELIEALVDSARPLAEERGLWLNHESPETLVVAGDAVKISRIAQNLLLNALKYTHKGGVTVSWGELDDDNWQFTVTDTGPGLLWPVPKKAADTQGEGIGLFIVRQLCEFLGGRVSVDSEPKKGTRFQVVLPRHYSD